MSVTHIFMPPACSSVQFNDQLSPSQLAQLALKIKQWGKELGFAQIGITDIDLTTEETKLQQWLDQQYHGEMSYMKSHGMMRARPQELHPGCLRVICARMDYLPASARFASNLRNADLGYISRYAGGRDYHKLIRNRMKKLGEKIDAYLKDSLQDHSKNTGIKSSNFRPFVDSAPIMERPLAAKAGLGWTGKHSLLLNPEAGSWFFLSELLVNLPLPVDIPIQQNCGHCVACIKTCPTAAIVQPYVIDARRCISYLTIELHGTIDEEFRPLIGNRIYGCDDCQLICPVNQLAPLTQESDFHIRSQLTQPKLLDLFDWTEAEFLTNTEGSAIRRIGYQRWLRNISIALGNAPYSHRTIDALRNKLTDDELPAFLQEHFQWALDQQQQKHQHLHLTNVNRKHDRLIRAIEKGLPRDAN